jgi:spermidine synthase
MRTFSERIYPYGGQELQVDALLHAGRSRFQDVLLFRNAFYGSVLVLDGVVQITERDEFVYSEMLAHVPLGAHPVPRAVLIVGGGDGGTLEEVLKHPGVERAVLVDLDGQVVDLCRQHLGAIHRGAFDDPRAEVLIQDGLEYARAARERFDVVLVDGPDPIGPGDAGCPLYSPEFFELCARKLLLPGGILVTQNDVPFHHPRAMAETAGALSRVFSTVRPYVAAVPSFCGGFMAFVAATNGDADVTRSGGFQPPETAYYTPALHAASFVLPPYVKAAMEGRAA